MNKQSSNAQKNGKTAESRIIREPLGGCRRTAIILCTMILGVGLVLFGIGVGPPVADVLTGASPPQPVAGLPTVTVYSDPACACCDKWIRHLQLTGFPVRHVTDPQMSARKTLLGIPPEMRSCHTATVDGYVVEGHVPGEDIRRMLKSRPPIKGLVLPGMPSGSPGMEPILGKGEPYTVLALQPDGSTRDYAVHRSQ